MIYRGAPSAISAKGAGKLIDSQAADMTHVSEKGNDQAYIAHAENIIKTIRLYRHEEKTDEKTHIANAIVMPGFRFDKRLSKNR